MSPETAAVTNERAKSLAERLELLYLSRRFVRVACMVDDGNGGLEEGEETLELEAPIQRDAYASAFELRKKYRDEFDSLSSPTDDAEFDIDTATDDDLARALTLLTLNTAMTVANVRLCCAQLRDSPDRLIEQMLARNGGLEGELATAASELCGSEGLATGGGSDPFGSAPATG